MKAMHKEVQIVAAHLLAFITVNNHKLLWDVLKEQPKPATNLTVVDKCWNTKMGTALVIE
jgi:hypothetical protein